MRIAVRKGLGSLVTVICWVALILAILGAINWGLIGVFNFNLVTFLFGTDTLFTKIIYILIGLSGLYSIYYLFKHK